MPTYEYECSKCGAVFDVFQSIRAKPMRKAMCEDCGSVQPVRRLIGTGGGVIFKGSGFYQTDYRSKSYRDAAKRDSGVSTESPASSSGGNGQAAKAGESSKAATAVAKEKPSDVKKPAKAGAGANS